MKCWPSRSAVMLALSFDDILKGCTVRITDDGMLFGVDLTMAITGKNKNESGEVLRNLKEELFLSTKFLERNTGGRGNTRTKLVTFHDALELIMVLPGKMAKEMRVKFSDIIRRFLAGDASNAISNNPVSVLARGPTLPTASVVEDNEESRKRRRMVEDLEIEERVANLKRIQNETDAVAASTQTHLMEVYKTLCSDGIMDDRARILFKDNVINLAMGDYAHPLRQSLQQRAVQA